jgi:hypothetical protein
MNDDKIKLNVSETFVQVIKFDGPAPSPGEIKEPIEIIEGTGDKIETVYKAGQGDEIIYYTGDDAGYSIEHSRTKRG